LYWLPLRFSPTCFYRKGQRHGDILETQFKTRFARVLQHNQYKINSYVYSYYFVWPISIASLLADFP
jgi:hypothetical protein